MNTTPRSERIHLTFFGLRNAGKSSLVNAIAGRPVAIVSPEAGTTTDPVERPMELGELGPVVLTDTAGLDDVGGLGALRVEKSLERLAWTDIALLATPLDRAPEEAEEVALSRLAEAGKLLVVVASFCDRPPHPAKEAWLAGLEGREGAARPALLRRASGETGEGVAELRNALAALGRLRRAPPGSHNAQTAARAAAVQGAATFGAAPRAPAPGAALGAALGAAPGDALGRTLGEAGPLEGLVEAGDFVLLVTPIDTAAPRGRLILPEAETLRDCLDRGCPTLVTRETELAQAYAALGRRPRLVVTDSQAFATVRDLLPADQALTSFSILFARKKGELLRFSAGLARVEELARQGVQSRAQGGAAGGATGRAKGGVRGDTRGEEEPRPPLRLLALEACTHNRTHEDIATVKIPALLAERTGRRVEVSVLRELSGARIDTGFDLAVICGACMATRGKLLSQLAVLEEAGLPALNFGLFLAWAYGILGRALAPLMEADGGLGAG